jgi:hypothetical protein
MTRRASTLRLLAVTCGLVAALAVLHGLGRGELGAPPWSRPAELHGWVAARGSVVAAFALLRQAAVLIAWYLLAATILGCVVRALRLGAARALVDHLTVPALRRFVGSVTSAGLASIVALGPSTPAGAEPPRPGIAVMHQLNSQPTPTPTPTTVVSPAPTALMRQLDGGSEASIEPVATTATVDDMWTVAPGDSFWLVAQEHLAATTGASPSEREVTRYWRALIEANRASLPDPLNPDLLFAAAVLVLPPV